MRSQTMMVVAVANNNKNELNVLKIGSQSSAHGIKLIATILPPYRVWAQKYQFGLEQKNIT